jgi:hypothetical protein
MPRASRTLWSLASTRRATLTRRTSVQSRRDSHSRAPRAYTRLRRLGLHVTLDVVGGAPAGFEVPSGLRLPGSVPPEGALVQYHQDCGVFVSSATGVLRNRSPRGDGLRSAYRGFRAVGQHAPETFRSSAQITWYSSFSAEASRWLARALADGALAELHRQLEYKASWWPRLRGSEDRVWGLVSMEGKGLC